MRLREVELFDRLLPCKVTIDFVFGRHRPFTGSPLMSFPGLITLLGAVAVLNSDILAAQRQTFAPSSAVASTEVPGARGVADSVRSRRLTYTLVGTVIGAVVGAAASGLAVWAAGGSQGCARVCRANDEASYIIAGTAIGAGLGAGIGFAVGSRRAAFVVRLRSAGIRIRRPHER